ncbi:MAG: hypothetical protein WA139_01255 [Candidatus Aenigmatarchaeota archaeon]
MELNEIQKNILTFLYKHYPDMVGSEKIIEELKINKDDLRKEIAFLEDEFLIEIIRFLGGNFLAKLTSLGRTTVNEFVSEKEGKEPKKAETEESTIQKIRGLQENVLDIRNDVNQKIIIFDKKLDEFYGRLIEIFGIFASIIALVSFTGNAIFNSQFNIYETFGLIIGFAVALGIFVYTIHKIIKN